MCKFVYIVRTDQNPFGSCQPFSLLYIMMTACATAYWATCALTCKSWTLRWVLTSEWTCLEKITIPLDGAIHLSHNRPHISQMTATACRGTSSKRYEGGWWENGVNILYVPDKQINYFQIVTLKHRRLLTESTIKYTLFIEIKHAFIFDFQTYSPNIWDKTIYALHAFKNSSIF